MLKASVLYLVIVVSLLIGLISASLLTLAFFYKREAQKSSRMEKLNGNLNAVRAILLSKDLIAADTVMTLDLYGEGKDSVVYSKQRWGLVELSYAKAFVRGDTLKQVFLSSVPFTDPSAIYLADEDRPLSLSGNTEITGDGQIPKAGLKQAYVDGKGYAGKELLKGKIKDSSRTLPELDQKLIDELCAYFKEEGEKLSLRDSVGNSFYNEAKRYKLSVSQSKLEQQKFYGKLVLISDTVLKIGAAVKLEDVLVFAPSIMVEDGFKGNCQLFARDSIVIGKNCVFEYPSFAGVFKPAEKKLQSLVKLGENTRFAGILCSYENKRSELQTRIALAKGCLVKGQIYAKGYIQMEKGVTVQGKVYATRFIMKTPSTLYENYLIDISLNRRALSKYYLGSALFKENNSGSEILKWLH
ncbi:hypothetical protein [Pedobacter nutrimenti]|uniref:Cytoskeletal protein CcmA (Bactofilin family) n=1 Tax=Pedobacter nutrimenti TaxID=1241337 RepID=A0A318UJM3_9SPHI|nr:hypothetical protein [Pedobacter nutrimenti]PYF76656.1 hypothetical protein B0O44_101127 [Pedobacter nutrimenti]